MNKRAFRILWLITGILLISAGIFAFFNPQNTLGWFVYLFAVVVLFSGFAGVVFYIQQKKHLPGSGWLLFDDITSLVFGALLLSTKLAAYMTLMLPYMLSVWVILRGFSALFHSFDLKNIGVPHWGMQVILGTLIIALGITTMFVPFVTTILISTIAGLSLISHGTAAIFDWYISGRIIFD